MYDKSMDATERFLTLYGEPEQAAGVKRVYATSGIKGVRRWIITQDSDPAKPWHNQVEVAENYALLGDKDKAFLRLEKAYEQRASELITLEVEPEWDSLRSDPRYADLVRRIGLPQ
jgi:hypothetical protein